MSLEKFKDENVNVLKFTKNILHIYYFYIDMIQRLNKENEELKIRIAEECKAKGISYDKAGSDAGKVSSHGICDKTYANELVMQQATVEIKIKEYHRALKHIRNDNKIREMLNCLTSEEKWYIIQLFKLNLSEGDIARKKKVSQPYVHKTVNKILSKMVEFKESL